MATNKQNKYLHKYSKSFCYLIKRNNPNPNPSSETQGQIVGARESLNRRENMAQEKSKERWEEPLGTMSYQTNSKRSPPFCLLIGARKHKFSGTNQSFLTVYSFLFRTLGTNSNLKMAAWKAWLFFNISFIRLVTLFVI